jgi:hypothetical protein
MGCEQPLDANAFHSIPATCQPISSLFRLHTIVTIRDTFVTPYGGLVASKCQRPFIQTR